LNLRSEGLFNFAEMKKVSFKTLGCRLNQYETDALVTQFHNAGYKIVAFGEEADVTIINMAGARDSTVISKKICSVIVGAIDSWAFSNPIEKKGVSISGLAAQLVPDIISINPK